MHLLLIRHAEMTGDPFVEPPSPVQGALSELGLEQAQALAFALAETRVDHVFVSPYGRAMQTAECVFGSRGVPIQILSFLKEWQPNRDLEKLPSTVHEEIVARHTHCYAEETWKTELGEGSLEMLARVGPAFLKALSEKGIHSRWGGFVPEPAARDLTLAVIAHGGSLGALLTFLLNIPPFPVGNFSFGLTGVADLRFTERKGVYYPQLHFGAPSAAVHAGTTR